MKSISSHFIKKSEMRVYRTRAHQLDLKRKSRDRVSSWTRKTELQRETEFFMVKDSSYPRKNYLEVGLICQGTVEKLDFIYQDTAVKTLKVMLFDFEIT